VKHKSQNKDDKVIRDFGQEWQDYNYGNISILKLKENFEQYFSIFPWERLSKISEGFDMGCGSGRWAQFVAPKVGVLNCIEPSDAIEVAKRNLYQQKNVNFYKQTTEECSIGPASQDFGYCLGVLHHIPNTENALADCVRLLKPGAPLLLYLYYNFENRSYWFRLLWRISDRIRRIICTLPHWLKRPICEVIALFVYWPLARLAYAAGYLDIKVNSFPLSDYARKPFYQMRNDSLDRFGTRIEKRFSKKQLLEMLTKAGLENIEFSQFAPFWCCLAYKKSSLS